MRAALLLISFLSTTFCLGQRSQHIDKLKCLTYNARTGIGTVTAQPPLPYTDTLRIFVKETKKQIELTQIFDNYRLIYHKADTAYTLYHNDSLYLDHCRKPTLLIANRADYVVLSLFVFLADYIWEGGRSFERCNQHPHPKLDITPNATIISMDTGGGSVRNIHRVVNAYSPDTLLQDWQHSFCFIPHSRGSISGTIQYVQFKGKNLTAICEERHKKPN